MNNQEKNGTKGLMVMLVIMLLFLVYQFVISPIINTEKIEETKKVEEQEVNLEELGEKLYAKFSLTIGEEYGITSDDNTLLNSKLSVYKMSDTLKLTLGIKNVGDEYITSDGSYSLKEAISNMNGNFYYSGKYITEEAIEKSLTNIFGAIPIEHQTITLRDNKYVYNKNKKIYEIWGLRKTPKYTEEKVTYKEVVVKDEEILVYEYVAYTDYADISNIKTRTVHSKSVGVVITEDDIESYLSYMDKYKYTFKKNEDGNYYFVSIEYMYE